MVHYRIHISFFPPPRVSGGRYQRRQIRKQYRNTQALEWAKKVQTEKGEQGIPEGFPPVEELLQRNSFHTLERRQLKYSTLRCSLTWRTAWIWGLDCVYLQSRTNAYNNINNNTWYYLFSSHELIYYLQTSPCYLICNDKVYIIYNKDYVWKINSAVFQDISTQFH